MPRTTPREMTVPRVFPPRLFNVQPRETAMSRRSDHERYRGNSAYLDEEQKHHLSGGIPVGMPMVQESVLVSVRGIGTFYNTQPNQLTAKRVQRGGASPVHRLAADGHFGSYPARTSRLYAAKARSARQDGADAGAPLATNRRRPWSLFGRRRTLSAWRSLPIPRDDGAKGSANRAFVGQIRDFGCQFLHPNPARRDREVPGWTPLAFDDDRGSVPHLMVPKKQLVVASPAPSGEGTRNPTDRPGLDPAGRGSADLLDSGSLRASADPVGVGQRRRQGVFRLSRARDFRPSPCLRRAGTVRWTTAITSAWTCRAFGFQSAPATLAGEASTTLGRTPSEKKTGRALLTTEMGHDGRCRYPVRPRQGWSSA